jgi:hypothetical protein
MTSILLSFRHRPVSWAEIKGRTVCTVAFALSCRFGQLEALNLAERPNPGIDLSQPRPSRLASGGADAASKYYFTR